MSEFQILTFIEDDKWACIRCRKSKMSEFDPRGGAAIFKNVWNSKKSEISDGGGGQAYLGIFPKFFRFFYDGSPYTQSVLNILRAAKVVHTEYEYPFSCPQFKQVFVQLK